MSANLHLNGTTLRYDARGSGPSTLLITGAGALRSVWHNQVAALLAAGRRVVTYDHRGSHPAPTPLSPYGLAELTDDAIMLLEALDLAPCAVVGFSLGGLVAQEIAVRRPELIDRLVLIATLARTDRYRTALARGFATHVRRGGTPDEYSAALLAQRMFSPVTLADDARIARWLTLFRTSAPMPAAAADQFEATVVEDRRDRVRLIAAPCLVISFADDASVPPGAGAELAAAIPNSVHHHLPRCGHLGIVEDAGAVNTLLCDFLHAGDRARA